MIGNAGRNRILRSGWRVGRRGLASGSRPQRLASPRLLVSERRANRQGRRKRSGSDDGDGIGHVRWLASG